VGRKRQGADAQIADLLVTAKQALRLSAAFMTRMDGTTQHLEVVESSVPFLFPEGVRQRQSTSFCQAILDGRLPAVIPDVAANPEARRLPAARIPRIRSFVSVPVRLSDGSLYGTFCAAGLTSDAELGERDEALMRVLAHAASVIIEPQVRSRERTTEIRDRLTPVLRAGGPLIHVQPIVSLGSERPVGVEALSRFPADWGKPPDVCFQEAHDVGMGHALETVALKRASEQLPVLDGYVAMNVSPATFLTASCQRLLRRLPLERVVLELSEHEPVEDYEVLTAALAPLRERGMRLAIDDVGAGYSSLRHLVLTAPDLIKLDRTLVAGVASDPVLQSLVHSMVDFGHGCAAVVVAEGIETAADADALLGLGVDYGQGWHFGRPAPATGGPTGRSRRALPGLAPAARR
jgi:EAL domain-containing protein (putative c-di-GMP-specific phosphodiesterase class I)